MILFFIYLGWLIIEASIDLIQWPVVIGYSPNVVPAAKGCEFGAA